MQVAAKASEGTVLNFLTRDGAVTAAFSAVLTAPQYATLFDCIRDYSETAFELKERVVMLANKWGLDATVEDGT